MITPLDVLKANHVHLRMLAQKALIKMYLRRARRVRKLWARNTRRLSVVLEPDNFLFSK